MVSPPRSDAVVGIDAEGQRRSPWRPSRNRWPRRRDRDPARGEVRVDERFAIMGRVLVGDHGQRLAIVAAQSKRDLELIARTHAGERELGAGRAGRRGLARKPRLAGERDFVVREHGVVVRGFCRNPPAVERDERSAGRAAAEAALARVERRRFSVAGAEPRQPVASGRQVPRQGEVDARAARRSEARRSAHRTERRCNAGLRASSARPRRTLQSPSACRCRWRGRANRCSLPAPLAARRSRRRPPRARALRRCGDATTVAGSTSGSSHSPARRRRRTG